MHFSKDKYGPSHVRKAARSYCLPRNIYVISYLRLRARPGHLQPIYTDLTSLMKPAAAISPIFSTFVLKFIAYVSTCIDSPGESTGLVYKNNEDLHNICF